MGTRAWVADETHGGGNPSPCATRGKGFSRERHDYVSQALRPDEHGMSGVDEGALTLG